MLVHQLRCSSFIDLNTKGICIGKRKQLILAFNPKLKCFKFKKNTHTFMLPFFNKD